MKGFYSFTKQPTMGSKHKKVVILLLQPFVNLVNMQTYKSRCIRGGYLLFNIDLSKYN